MKTKLCRILGGLAAVVSVALPSAAPAADNNWLASLPDGTRLSQISIPGTHDSCARFETVTSTAKCQTSTIAEQLNFGVRFLDIRCRHIHDAFAIYHGPVSQNMTFADVLHDVTAFLKDNPRETVILSVKEEHTPSGNTRGFEATFDSQIAASPGIWSLGAGVPTLHEARGKIVLFRRFATKSAKGVNATRWPDNALFSANNLSVQDWYQATDTGTKWNHISKALSGAASDPNPDILHLNFTSGYKPGLLKIPDITTVSDAVHPKLAAHLAAAPPGHYGCILLDFADANLCRLIYRKNQTRER